LFFVSALALAGFLLIFLEFFLPGAVMAIGGSVLLLASAFFFHMSDPRPLALLLYLAGLLFAVYLIVRIALWRLRASARVRNISEGLQEGFQASVYPKELIGKAGIAATDLKPSGQIWLDDRTFEALSKAGAIEKGTPVEILSGQGSHLIVRPKPPINGKNR
jgi:membrane-bound ClpP family serine protease